MPSNNYRKSEKEGTSIISGSHALKPSTDITKHAIDNQSWNSQDSNLIDEDMTVDECNQVHVEPSMEKVREKGNNNITTNHMEVLSVTK